MLLPVCQTTGHRVLGEVLGAVERRVIIRAQSSVVGIMRHAKAY